MEMLIWWTITLGLLAAQTAAQPTVGSCTIFPAGDEWNRPIDTDAVDPYSACYITTMSFFDRGSFSAPPLRLDYSMASAQANNSALVPLTFGTDGVNYQAESDWYTQAGDFRNGDSQKPWGNAYLPIPQNAPIEGRSQAGADPDDGDRHIMVVDTGKCLLYETYNSVRLSSGFQVSSTAIWNLTRSSTGQRPIYWTSPDAAGLPIYPGVLKVEEITGAGEINHALRFTSKYAQAAFVSPASHYGPHENASLPYYGLRMRLKSTFDISSYSSNTQKLLRALKKYGLIFADQGTTGYITATDVWSSWPGDINEEVNQDSTKRILINTANFEVVVPPSAINRDFQFSGDPCPWLAGIPSPGSPSPSHSSRIGPLFSLLALALVGLVVN